LIQTEIRARIALYSIRKIFAQISSATGRGKVSKAIVAATSAFRDAKNGAELLKSLADEFKLNCKILSGQDEAAYMSEGLKRRELFDSEHTHLHMDIGGGSLELSLFDDGEFKFQESLDVGALRLVKDTTSGSLKDDFAEQLSLIDSCLKAKDEIKKDSLKPLKLHGTGGNFKRLARLKVENLILEDESFFSAKNALEMLNLFKKYPGQELCKHTSIKEDNAALIVPSLIIVERVLKFWPADQIEVPDLSLSHTLLDTLI